VDGTPARWQDGVLLVPCAHLAAALLHLDRDDAGAGGRRLTPTRRSA
jgi:hypothetical protein